MKKVVAEKIQQFLPSNRETFRQQSLIVFNKLIRTKNLASLQEDPIHGGLGGGKEPGSLQVRQALLKFPVRMY